MISEDTIKVIARDVQRTTTRTILTDVITLSELEEVHDSLSTNRPKLALKVATLIQLLITMRR